MPHDVKKYVNLQCNNVLSDYETCPEMRTAFPILSKLRPSNVLELGSGIGRVSVFLRNYFKWDTTNFYLLDGDSGDVQIAGIHYTTNKDFYNSLDATKSFCVENNISEERLFLVNAETCSGISDVQFDLCYSCKAIGFHWPINDYLVQFSKNFEVGSYLFFELRSNDKKVYSTEERWKRVMKIVDMQVNGINRSDFDVIKLPDEDPLLILRKI